MSIITHINPSEGSVIRDGHQILGVRLRSEKLPATRERQVFVHRCIHQQAGPPHGESWDWINAPAHESLAYKPRIQNVCRKEDCSEHWCPRQIRPSPEYLGYLPFKQRRWSWDLQSWPKVGKHQAHYSSGQWDRRHDHNDFRRRSRDKLQSNICRNRK